MTHDARVQRKLDELNNWTGKVTVQTPKPALRVQVLRDAERTITKDRQDQYGSAEDCFGMIAGMWSAYLGQPVTGFDVAQLMTLLKVARSKANPGHQDNQVDACGYQALAAEMV